MTTITESPTLDLSGIAPAPVRAAADSMNLPATHEEAPPPAEAPEPPAYTLDDFKWVPVLRKPRADGRTPQRQVDFIAALADTGCVEEAAQEVGMSARSCYRLRRSPGAEQFAAAWDAATAQAARRLVDIAFDRAIHGTDEPVFDRDGRRIGRRMRQNDRLLMFLLRAYMPERFRHAHESVRKPAETPAPEPAPVAEAIGAVEPPMPDNPHLLMSPQELDDEIEIAVLADGELPHWHRYRRAEPVTPSLPPELEQMLDEAKEANAGDHWHEMQERKALARARRESRFGLTFD
jgi:hypothetical protein